MANINKVMEYIGNNISSDSGSYDESKIEKILKKFTLGGYSLPHNLTSDTWKSIGSLKIDIDNNREAWLLDGAVKSHHVEGPNNWQYGHNVLTYPGYSKHSFTFDVPENAKSVRLLCKYFGPWNFDAIYADLYVNGELYKARSPIRGEHEGRTTDELILQKWEPTGNEFKLDFVEGLGVLYLWQYEVEVQY